MQSHFPDTHRCAAFLGDEGRCQLSSGHTGPHALYLGEDRCVSWSADHTRYWRLPPPPWIVDLPWAPGCQLPVRIESTHPATQG